MGPRPLPFALAPARKQRDPPRLNRPGYKYLQHLQLPLASPCARRPGTSVSAQGPGLGLSIDDESTTGYTALCNSEPTTTLTKLCPRNPDCVTPGQKASTHHTVAFLFVCACACAWLAARAARPLGGNPAPQLHRHSSTCTEPEKCAELSRGVSYNTHEVQASLLWFLSSQQPRHTS